MTRTIVCPLSLLLVLASAPFLSAQIQIQGPATAPAGTATSWTWNPVAGAAAYRIRTGLESSAAWLEGAETSPAPRITDNSGVSYALIVNAPVFQGSKSFHLAIPDFDSEPQSFTIERWILPANGWRLQFRHLLRYFTVECALVAEMSQDDGQSWTEVWRRHGDAASDSGTTATFETAWQAADVALPGGTGSGAAKFRFRIMPANRLYDGDTVQHGCFVDAITVTGASTLESPAVTTTGSATSFSFTAPAAGTWALQAASRTAAGTWSAWGPPARLQAQAPGGLAAWRTTYFGTSSNTGTAADQADADGDGLTNLVEYAMGSIPTDRTSGTLPQAVRVGSSFQIDYPRHPGRTDVALTPLVSADLSAWLATGAPGAPAGFTDSLLSSGTVDQRRATIPATQPRLFLQLRATAQ